MKMFIFTRHSVRTFKNQIAEIILCYSVLFLLYWHREKMEKENIKFESWWRRLSEQLHLAVHRKYWVLLVLVCSLLPAISLQATIEALRLEGASWGYLLPSSFPFWNASSIYFLPVFRDFPNLCELSKITERPCSGPSSAPQHLCVHPVRPHGLADPV